jgi:hypothetical protein
MANIKQFRDAQATRNANRGGGNGTKLRPDGGKTLNNTGIYHPPTATENNLRTMAVRG